MILCLFLIKYFNTARLKAFQQKIIESTSEIQSEMCSKKKRAIVLSGIAETKVIIKQSIRFATEVLSPVINRMKQAKVRAAAISVVAAMCLTVTAAAYAAELKSAVEVFVNGQAVGCVENQEEAESVKAAVLSNVYCEPEEIVFTFSDKSVMSDRISETEKLISSVFSSIKNARYACGLFVDGVLTATTANFSEMNSNLSSIISANNGEGLTFSGFTKDVILQDIYITDAYFSKTEATAEQFKNGTLGVEAAFTKVETFTQELRYETIEQENSKYYQSYKRITQKGVNGVAEVTAEVTYINGVKANVDVIETKVITEPKSEIKVVGTKKDVITHNGYDLATSVYSGSSEMVFPVKLTTNTYISSYWGDGRNHKGIDIAAPKGTEIYSADDGTVSFVGTKSGYGKVIIIDHNDGKTQSIYSHNSKNLVAKGQKVTAGQTIAYVGATGNATGNHLHFAVSVNGTFINPAKKIGLTKQ